MVVGGIDRRCPVRRDAGNVVATRFAGAGYHDAADGGAIGVVAATAVATQDRAPILPPSVGRAKQPPEWQPPPHIGQAVVRQRACVILGAAADKEAAATIRVRARDGIGQQGIHLVRRAACEQASGEAETPATRSRAGTIVAQRGYGVCLSDGHTANKGPHGMYR